MVTIDGLGWAGSATIGGELGPGEAVLLSPNHPHAYRTADGAKGWEFRWAHFHPRPDWLPLLSWPEAHPGLRRASLGDEFGDVIQSLATVQEHADRMTDPFEERLAMVALEAVLVRTRRAATSSETGDPRVRKASGFVLRHLADPIGPLELAQFVGISASRLGRLFRKEFGISPRTFIENQRMTRARQLLAMTDLPIKAVAAEIGFASEFYFANRFRQAVGTSPSGYRTSARRATPESKSDSLEVP